VTSGQSTGRKDNRPLVPRGAETGEDSEHGRAALGVVVDDREGQLQRVGLLANGDDLRAGLVQHAPPTLGERLAAKGDERLRRSEALGCPADEQDARRRYTIRHGSV